MDSAADLFRLLGVEARIGLIELLKAEPRPVSVLAETLGMTASAVSQHLRILKSGGLVRGEKRGQWVYYRLNEEKLAECRERASQVCACGCRGDDPRQEPADLPSDREGLESYRKKLEEELRRVEERIGELERR